MLRQHLSLLSLAALLLAFSSLQAGADAQACTSNSDCDWNQCCQGSGSPPSQPAVIPASGDLGFTSGQCQPRPSNGQSCIAEYGSNKLGGDTSDVYASCPCLLGTCAGTGQAGPNGTPGVCSSLK